MTRLVVTADADVDTGEILDYLTREAGWRVADEYGQRFREALERVVEMPESGAPRQALGPETHIAVVYPYVLIYDYSHEIDTVTLLRVLHGRRNITRDLLKR
jgi:toxin ParE1/3/4